MQSKIKEREKAIALRKEGLSYSEILRQIPVAKSSLSLWLKSVKLAVSQKQRLTDKKRASAMRGAMKRKTERIALTKEIKDKARGEIGRLTKRELFLIGVALYWAEGSKEKEYRPGSKVVFSNSDPQMIKVFLQWLLEIIKLPKKRISFSIYIHDSHKNRVEEVKRYWSEKTGFTKENFQQVYFKRNKVNTKRRNIGNTYFGLLRVLVTESSGLNRRIQGWTEGLYQ